jgi:5-methylcytosine-specific restriction protein A
MRSRRKNLGRDARWQRESKRYLRVHPYCECVECVLIPEPLRPTATEVDHIDGLGPIGPRGYDWSNLRAMTKAHHARETARNQPGGWNDRP